MPTMCQMVLLSENSQKASLQVGELELGRKTDIAINKRATRRSVILAWRREEMEFKNVPKGF